MDLSHPERSFGGRLDMPILVLLSQAERSWSSGEVARRLGASTVGAREALRRLVEVGLVHSTQVGRSQGYRLNRDHVLAAVVTAAGAAGKLLRRRIADAVAGWEIPAQSAVLFGSWARQEAGADSDIDLLLVHADFDSSAAEDSWVRQTDALDLSIRAWSGNRCDLLSVSVSDWLDIRGRQDPLAESFAADAGVLLHGTPLSAIGGGGVSRRRVSAS